MSPSEYAVKVFGGVLKLSRVVDRHPVSVYRWLDRGNIPSSLMPAILTEAKKRKLKITAEDLIFGKTNLK